MRAQRIRRKTGYPGYLIGVSPWGHLARHRVCLSMMVVKIFVDKFDGALGARPRQVRTDLGSGTCVPLASDQCLKLMSKASCHRSPSRRKNTETMH